MPHALFVATLCFIWVILSYTVCYISSGFPLSNLRALGLGPARVADRSKAEEEGWGGRVVRLIAPTQRPIPRVKRPFRIGSVQRLVLAIAAIQDLGHE